MVNLKIKTQNNEFNLTKEEGTNCKVIIKSQYIDFKFPCGGKGICGRCKVNVIKGANAPTKPEEKKISADELEQGKRLACCFNLNSDTEIELTEKTSGLLGSIFKNKK